MATLTTPVWALPWPDGAERVMDGDNAMGALAAAVEAALVRINTPQGVVATGNVKTGITGAAAVVPLDAVSFGPAAWLDNANDRIVIPASGVLAGWYSMEVYATVDKGVSGTVAVVTIEAGSSAAPAAMALQSVVLTGALLRTTFSASGLLSPGDIVRVMATAPGGGTIDAQIRRLVVRRVGAPIGA